MKLIAAAGILASAFLLTGCAGKSDGVSGPRGVSSADVAELNSRHARFEGSEDPPIRIDTHFAAGQLAESQGSPAKAVAQYQAALKLNAAHLPSLYRLGVIYAQHRAWPDAIATWERYVRESGEDATAWSNLAFCLELAGRTEEAESAYLKGIARDSKNHPCRVNLGLMLARQGRTNEAIVQLQQVLSEAEVHYNLGSVHEMLGHREEARAAYRKVMQLDPSLLDAKARLAALE